MSAPRLVHSETIGTYPSSDAADFKGDVFEGSFRAEVSSHHYFWPTDVQGRSYKESEDQGISGSGNTGE